MITVCIPVLRRYDMLRKLLVSLRASTVVPDVIIIDNGRNAEQLAWALDGRTAHVITPPHPWSVAESWNCFIKHVPEDRLIANDDVEFAPQSLELMSAQTASFVSCSFGFSCFIIRDACVNEVGMFDEAISPGYAYFEDMDYLRRMRLAGIEDAVVDCGVVHHQSQTPKAFSADEIGEHHQRFHLAQQNYEAKWASKPSWEQLKMIGGAGANA